MVGRDSSNSRDCVDVRFTPANYRIEPGLDHKGLRGLSTAASTNPRLERILASHTIADPSSRGNDGPGRNDVPVSLPALTRPGFAPAFLEPRFAFARGPRLPVVLLRAWGRL